MRSFHLLMAALFIGFGLTASAQCDVYISEYSEGSSSNKYIELYNPTSQPIDLSQYAIASVSNEPTTVGVHEYWNTFTEGATIAPGDVYVWANGSSDPTIIAETDQTGSAFFNGDDGYALVFGTEDSYVFVDIIGNFEGDPGSGWEVAGVPNATKDHTLVRKSNVTQGIGYDWAASAGTNADDSEWIVYDQNTWGYLGAQLHGDLRRSSTRMHQRECDKL